MSTSLTRLITAAFLVFALGQRAVVAQAACFGDCNGSGTLTASDIGRINSTILRCGPCPDNIPGGVASGCETLVNGCPGADFNSDGCLRASELARANQNILKYQPSGCAPEATATGGSDATPTPTDTAAPPTETPPPTNTPAPTFTPAPPTLTATPTVNPAVCGNGLLENGETCAGCAADCTVSNCTAVATPPRTFRVDYAPPPGQPVTAIKVRVAYRSNLMSLPGVGPTPATRVKNRPSNTTTIVNDLNYAVEVTMSRSAGLAEGRLFTVDFDGCSGAATPAVTDLFCSVLDCGSSFGSVEGCTCLVRLP